jgi:hypothetical protein
MLLLVTAKTGSINTASDAVIAATFGELDKRVESLLTNIVNWYEATWPESKTTGHDPNDTSDPVSVKLKSDTQFFSDYMDFYVRWQTFKSDTSNFNKTSYDKYNTEITDWENKATAKGIVVLTKKPPGYVPPPVEPNSPGVISLIGSGNTTLWLVGLAVAGSFMYMKFKE